MTDRDISTLIEVLGNMGHVKPSEVAPWLDAAAMGATLVERADVKRKPPRTEIQPDGSEPVEVSTPLWRWFSQSGGMGWSEQDVAMLDAWCGSRDSWWLHPVDAAGTTMLDAWLMRCDHAIAADPRTLPLLQSVPDECFQGVAGRARVVSILRAERVLAAPTAFGESRHHASDSLLARGVDLFADTGNLQYLSSLPQLAQVQDLHAEPAKAWLSDDANYAMAVTGHRDRRVRVGLEALATRTQSRTQEGAEGKTDAVRVEALFADAAGAFLSTNQYATHAKTFLQDNPELQTLRDESGRTMLMSIMNAVRSNRKSHRQLFINTASVLRTRAYRNLCTGRDAEGRSLWPYLLRIKEKNPSASSERLYEMLVEQEGLPSVDAAGHGLLHQVLYNRTSTGLYEECPVTAYESVYDHGLLDKIRQAPPSAWLGDPYEEDLPDRLMHRLEVASVASGDPCTAATRREVNFLAAMSPCLEDAVPTPPPAWCSLFMNVLIMRSLWYSSTSSILDEDLARMRKWMVPGVSLWPKVRAMVAEGAVDAAAKDMGKIVAEADAMEQMATIAQSLSKSAVSRPRRRT